MVKIKNNKNLTSGASLLAQPKSGVFYDDKGNKVEREYYEGPNGTYYTYNNDYKAVPIVLFDRMSPEELEKWRQTAPNSPYRKTVGEVQQRQAMMKAAGYNVPNNGLWDDDQQSVWDKLTIKNKDYDTTLKGFLGAMGDKATGNTTYRDDPLIQDAVKTYDSNNVDWDKTNRSHNKFINAVDGTWGPIAELALAPWLLKYAVSSPLAATANLVGGSLGGWAVNKASEAITGKSIGDNVAKYTPFTSGMGEMANLGYYVGGAYGNFVRNNLASRGRYTLNYLSPASYKGHWLDFPLTISKPFYRKPPTFYNNRKPSWYAKYAQKEGIDAAEQRFQNGLVWAGIPEEETAHPMYIKNTDESYRLSQDGFSHGLGRPSGAALVPNKTKIDQDWFTISGIGGEHSNFKKIGDWMGAKLMQFEDEQKLNPQWLLTDPVKRGIGKYFSENNKAYKFLDQLGGKSASGVMGYKPFTIKQNYIHTGNKVYPIYEDPANASNIPNFIIHRD